MKELGAKFNLAESTISGYENETRKPDLDLIDKFADFFEVKADFLLGRTDDPNPTEVKSTAASSSGNRPYMAYFGGPPEELDEEEAAHLEQELEMFRAFREKRLRDKGQQKDK
jgi:transcriptional regulator with XRE-family HTH domain